MGEKAFSLLKVKGGKTILNMTPYDVYFDVAMATHPVPDCYYAGMVTPVFDLEQILSTS